MVCSVKLDFTVMYLQPIGAGQHLWTDFDNDGWKDLFISNGIPKRLNDMDYMNYVSNDELQEKIRANRMDEKDMALIEKFPQIKLANKFYLNKGEAKFDDAGYNN